MFSLVCGESKSIVFQARASATFNAVCVYIISFLLLSLAQPRSSPHPIYLFIYLRLGPHNPSNLFCHAHFLDTGRERRHNSPTIPLLSLHSAAALTATVIKAAGGVE